jgi:hypothetical protein
MAITAKDNRPPRELIEAGNYIARCYQMIEIGTVKEDFQGQEKTLTKVRIGWELPTELKVFKEENGEQPRVISNEYTLSMADKATLRKHLEAWRGKTFSEEEAKNFDITKLLGVPCQLNIIHKASKKDASKVYEQISNVSPLMKGINCPAAINPIFVLSFDDWDVQKFESLPDFIKDKIKTSDEYKAMYATPSKEQQFENNSQDKPFVDASKKNAPMIETPTAGTAEPDPNDLPF